AVVAFAVVAITSEYATGLIHTTFTALPRRGRVLAAKAALVGGSVFVASLVAAAIAFVAGQHLLRANGYGPPGYPVWTLPAGAARRAVLGSALFLAALAVLALGVGTIVRRSAAAITAVLALLLMPLLVAPALPDHARRLLQRLTPGAGLAVQQTVPR